MRMGGGYEIDIYLLATGFCRDWQLGYGYFDETNHDAKRKASSSRENLPA
jgi:hypothetical protein